MAAILRLCQVFSHAPCQLQKSCIIAECPHVNQVVINQQQLPVNPCGIVQEALMENIHIMLKSIILFTSMIVLIFSISTMLRSNKQKQDNRAGTSNKKQFAIERIISQRSGDREDEYLVKWVGYSDDDNTWEPSTNLDSKS